MVRVSVVIKLFLVTFLTVTLTVIVVVFEQKSFAMDLQSSMSQSSSHETALPQRTRSSPSKRPFTGELNVHPVDLQGRCVTVRFRGTNESMSMDEAVVYLHTSTATAMYSDSSSQGYTKKQPLHVGVVFVDEPDGFLSLARGVFHLFHFLEFLVVGYTGLHRLASASTGIGIRSLPPKGNSTTTLSTGIPSISVPWIYAPLMTESEICGAAGGINCLIADLVLQASSASALQLQDWRTGIHGLESNDVLTAQSHASFRGQHSRRKTKLPVSNVQAITKYQKMVQDADAAILINRADCMDDTHKMWNGRIDNFPAEQWHSDISKSLGSLELPPPSSTNTTTNRANNSRNKKLVVGYIDRQNTKRSLPPAEHAWLTRYLSEHALVEFYHLHNMEDYSPLKQIEMTASCDMIIGAHGNGMSHVFWMQPKRYVVEIFWRFRYQFDYAFASAMMDHAYLALFDGEPIDAKRIERTDPTLKKMHRQRFTYDQNMTAIQDRIATGRLAIQQFLQDAMDDLNIHL